MRLDAGKLARQPAGRTKSACGIRMLTRGHAIACRPTDVGQADRLHQGLWRLAVKQGGTSGFTGIATDVLHNGSVFPVDQETQRLSIGEHLP